MSVRLSRALPIFWTKSINNNKAAISLPNMLSSYYVKHFYKLNFQIKIKCLKFSFIYLAKTKLKLNKATMTKISIENKKDFSYLTGFEDRDIQFKTYQSRKSGWGFFWLQIGMIF